MVNVLDSLVGNLTAALTAKGMMKNLVFVYSADNGGGPMDGSNYPLIIQGRQDQLLRATASLVDKGPATASEVSSQRLVVRGRRQGEILD